MSTPLRWLRAFVLFVSWVNRWQGRIASFFILPMMLALVWEVVMRYAFNAPTRWAYEVSEMFFGAHLILGGAYALVMGAHVSVDVFYARFSPRRRAVIDSFSWTFFFLFVGVLLWQTWGAALSSIQANEHSPTIWGPPVWPIKLLIPVAVFLLLVQGVAKYVCDLHLAVTGRPFLTATAR